ncbi:hypothetical protein IAT38_002340 [Cryptococcus sp. DSM 104549]
MSVSPVKSKGKGKEKENDKEEMTEEERVAAEKRQRDFERSLAGPSVGKAGLVRDQTEINRIIAEASKGSKYVIRCCQDFRKIHIDGGFRYYNNQVRKDQELTEKIAWYREKRDELLKMARVEQVEAEADRILMEAETSRDLSQTIIHVDMDAFYAACEVQRDPSLKGKPFGVGRGVLTTASYEARQFGARSGMAGFIAKKLCPHIILTDMHFDLYIAASKAVREVLVQYDENLMMASLDEGYLNITPYMSAHNMTAAEVVTQLRAQVEERTKLTISAGIAPNRMLAKICSDRNKPNGQYEMEFDRAAIVRFMRDLPIRKIPGFGRVTERCLEGLGVETCGDIYEHRAELLLMDHWFGFRGLCKAYLGIADNTVSPGKREERKSVGVERTFRDKSSDEDIMATLVDIAEELEKDLERLEYAGKTVTVKYKLHTYENKTRARSVPKYISTAKEFLPIAQELLKKELPLRIRLLGIRLSTLKDLTLPDKGIKGFFKASAKDKNAAGPSRSATPAEDVPEMLRLDADDVRASQEASQEFALEEEGEQNLADDSDPFAPGDHAPSTSSSILGKRKSPSPSTTLPTTSTSTAPISTGPTCPICGKDLPDGTSNQELNDHVDWCLNKDAIDEASRLSPVAAKRASVKKPKTKRKADKAEPEEEERHGGRVKKKGAGKGGGVGSITNWLGRG